MKDPASLASLHQTLASINQLVVLQLVMRLDDRGRIVEDLDDFELFLELQ